MGAENQKQTYVAPGAIQEMIDNLPAGSYLTHTPHRAFYVVEGDRAVGTYFDAAREILDESRSLGVELSERSIIEAGLRRTGLTQEAANQILRQSVETLPPQAVNVT